MTTLAPTCDGAYQQWASGRLGAEPLTSGAITLHGGAQCPLDETPDQHLLPVAAHIPPGQPPYQPEQVQEASTGAWWVSAVALALVVAVVAIAVRVATMGPRRAGGGVDGKHHWPDDRESEGDTPDLLTAPPSGVDVLADVTGLGPVRESDSDARMEAAGMDAAGQPDLRGDRDVDPQAPNPWSGT